jgi:hypothetical protein
MMTSDFHGSFVRMRKGTNTARLLSTSSNKDSRETSKPDGTLNVVRTICAKVVAGTKTEYKEVPNEGDCGDEQGSGNGRDEAGGAARAKTSNQRCSRPSSCVGMDQD